MRFPLMRNDQASITKQRGLAGSRRRRFRILFCEQLEDRRLLAQVLWAQDTDGFWDVPGNWSTGSVPTAADNVVIDRGAANPVITIRSGTQSVRSIQSAEAITLTGGTLTAVQTIDMSNTLRLSGGTLKSATLNELGGALIEGTYSGGTLDGVTVNGDLDLSQQNGASLSVMNSLVLNGTILLGQADGSTRGSLYFGDGSAAAQSFSGAAAVLYGGNASNEIYNASAGSGMAGTLTIASTVNLHGKSGRIANIFTTGTIVNQGTISANVAGGTIIVGGGTVTNQGTIEATSGGTLNVAGLAGNVGNVSLSGTGSQLLLGGTNWINNLGLTSPAGTTLTLAGTWSSSAGLNVVGGTVNLGGAFTTAGLNLSSFSRTGGNVNLTGTVDNTGHTLGLNATTGSWNFVGGTITNGILSESSNSLLVGTGSRGTLDGVTVNGDLDLRQQNGASLMVTNSLVLNGTILLGQADGSNRGSLYFGDGSAAAQSFSGAAAVLYGGSASNEIYNASAGSGMAGTLTIASTVNLHGKSGRIANFFTTGTIVNQGTISANVASGTIIVGGGTVTNQGTIEATGGGTLNMAGLAGNVGNVSLSGTGSQLLLGGTNWVNNLGLTTPAGTILTLAGTWSSFAGLNVAGGTVNLGGTFTTAGLNLPSFSRTGGIVNLTGTLDNTGHTLGLNATTGSWNFIGGTITNGILSESSNALLVGTGSRGTLDGVTVNGDLDLSQQNGASLMVMNSLVLNGTILLGNADGSTRGSLYFGDGSAAAQSFSGAASVLFGGSASNEIYNVSAGSGVVGALTIASTVHVHGKSGFLKNFFTTGTIVNQGTISADVAGGTITVGGEGTVINQGSMESNSGILSVTNLSAIDDPAMLRTSTTGTIIVSGNFTGNTRNVTLFRVAGTLQVSGGTSDAPRLFEAMSEDGGNFVSSFSNNFAFGTLVLSNNSYIRLVDQSDNARGIGVESVYADAVIVPAGSILDMNGLHLFSRTAQIDGMVINGTIVQIPDSGELVLNDPTPGRIAVSGELDEWKFFGFGGRSIGVIVNPGNGSLFAALSPQLAWADIQLLDSQDHVLATATSASASAIASISNFSLPKSDVYKVRVRAAIGHSSNTGNYNVAAFDVSADNANLNFNQQVFGTIESPFALDNWNFSAASGTQIQFLLKNRSSSGIVFSLNGPNGYVSFSRQTPTSDPISLPESGNYTLTVIGANAEEGNYSFQIMQVSQTELTLGQVHNGVQVGSGQAQLFRVPMIIPKPMIVTFTNAEFGDKVEIYFKLGAPPTRADYQTQAKTNASGVARIIVPIATPGDWFILVYGTNVSPFSNFALIVVSTQVALETVTPDRYGTNSIATLTLLGSGFLIGTKAALVATDGTTYQAQHVAIDSFTQITASLDLNGVPVGTYAVRVTGPDGAFDIFPAAFHVESAGVGHLETDLIVPSVLGRHQIATIYVEYANTGSAVLPAPILIVHSIDPDDSDMPLLTLDPSRLVQDLWTSAVPQGLSHEVQIYGSGATPGLLFPGERIRVPVYYSGLQQPWYFSDTSVELTLGVHEAGSTDAIDWASLKASLRPDWIASIVWDAVYPNLTSQIGTTWGDYVQMLSENAVYLGRLGLKVTDVNQLYNFELQQALGFSPISTLASAVDDSLPAPGLALSFARTYANNIVDRYNSGAFGQGWIAPWQISLDAAVDGTVTVHESANAFRIFLPDSRKLGAHFSQKGDTGVFVKLADGSYQLTETNGQLMKFRADGKLDFTKDVHGNRITAGFSAGKLSSLTHSSGGSFTISYNAAGLIGSISDSAGRMTTYGYDPTNTFLTSVVGPSGTTSYTYDQSNDATHKFALLSSQDPSGVVQHFGYDSHGRLSSTFTGNHLQELGYTYDSAGTVTTTDAAGIFNKLFYDYRGLPVRSEDSLGNFVNYEYDAGFHLARETNSLGYSRAYTWCDCGQPKTITDELGHTTSFTLGGPLNKPNAFTDANGNTTRYGYDTAGDVTSTTYADGSVERTIYDALGNATSLINRRGQAIAMAYNAAGQLASEAFPDGSTNLYSYDVRGRLTSVTSSTQGITSFSYDSADRLTRVDYPTGRSLLYQYDAAGRRTQLADNTTYLVKYVYDTAGRLAQLLDGSNGDAPLVAYTYDIAGRLSREDKGNNTYSTYTYDAVGRIQNIVHHAPNGSVNSRFDYTYDTLGRRTGMATVDGAWTYTYDLTGQLTRAVFASTNASISNQDLNYIYDALGNRVRTILNGATASYTTNNLNQYVTVGNVTNRYDADGNLIQEIGPNGTRSYTYDTKNHLVQLVTPEGTWQYEYDALGNRIAATLNGQRTSYLNDPTGLVNVIADVNAVGMVDSSFTYGLGLVSMTQGGGRSFYDFDAIGSTAGLTNVEGDYANRYRYLPFGEHLTLSGTSSNPFQFVGQFGVSNEGSDLQFMRARYYRSTIGKFESVDPLHLRGGLNFYTYVLNSPQQYLDPQGLRGGQYFDPEMYNKQDWPIEHDDLICNFLLGELGTACSLTYFPEKFGEWFPDRGPDKPHPYVPTVGFPDGPPPGVYDTFPWLPEWPWNNFPKPPNNPTDTKNPKIVQAFDPNEKLAGGGFGEQGYIPANAVIPYRINFENEPSATAPAQQVVVTDQLSTNLDWSTFQFMEFGFGDNVATVPTSSPYYFTALPMTYNGHDFNVQVELSFDPSSGLIRVLFLSIDPATDFPPDVLTGFLPPEDGTGRGLGYFSYSVRTKSGLTSGTEIRNVGLISFDEQTIIGTNQVNPHDPLQGIDPNKEALTTIDAGGPTSSVNALAATQSSANFSVTWSGTDDASGSGIGDYDIYVSDNNGLFTRWLIGTTLTSASYIGQNGHSYAFYSVATDNVGHHEAAPSTADSSTTVNTNSPPTLASVSLTPTTAFETSTLTATPVGGADADGDPITYSYQWFVNGSPIAPITSTLTGTYFNKGNTVSVRVTPNDGTASGTPVDSNTVTISNSLPSLTSVSLTPTTAFETTTLTATPVGGSDADGDPITYIYQWFVNGSPIAPTTSTLTGMYFNKGNTVSVRVTANDGTASGTPVDSNTVTISNSPPTFTSVSLTPTSAFETSTLTAPPVGGVDADGDPIKYAYQWFVNGSPIAPTTSTLTGTYFNKGNTVSVRVTPNDGTASGTPVDSNTVTISNSSPTAISQSVTTPKDTTKIIPLAGNDVDGDSLTFVVVSSPTHGSLSGTAPNLTYVPSANYVGSDSFSYRANDGMLDSNLAVVTIAITPVKVAPVIDMLSSTSVNENGTVHLTGTYRVAGTQGTQTLTINWGEGTPQTVTVMGGSFNITHQYQDDNPSNTASDMYAISVELTDAVGTATKSTTTSITNLAPVFVGSITGPATAVPGQIASFSTVFSDVGKLDSHTVTINWGDGNISTGIITETIGTGVGTAAGNHTYAGHGTYTITFTLADDDQGVTTKSISLVANQSIFVLHSTAAGAFTASGNRTINVTGIVVVDSNSSTAITASGNVRLTASNFDVVGGIKTTGNAQLIGPVTHTFVPDPLAGLATPALGAVQAAVNVSGNSSRTINPGTHSSITVSGKGFLTLTPGVYILSGGGFSVSGNGRVTGSGVSIVNMASATGSTGSINFSGNGDVTLTPTTSGPLTGILIFQPSNNTKALTISGNASAGINGTIYAPKAQLNISGNGSFTETIIVDLLTLSGNGSNLVAAATSSPVATSNSWVMYTSSTTGVEGLGLTKYDQSLRTNNGYIEEIEGRDQLFASLATAPAKPGMAGSIITRKAKTDTLGLVDSEKEELLEEDLLEAIALYRIA